MKGQRNHTRKETRDNLKQCSLALELARILKHFFPDLLLCFGQLPDPRHQSYITYPAPVLLMTRILSSLCYISSMQENKVE